MALILWSGGLDSTLALYRALTGAPDGSAWLVGVGAKELDRRYATRALSLQCGTAFAGQRWLPRARKRIAKLLRDAGLDFDHRTVVLDGGRGCGPRQGADGQSPQSPTWVAIASLMANASEDVELPFLRGEMDRADKLRAAFDALQAASYKTGKLYFPLSGHTKADVLHELHHLPLKGLDSAAWWCEEPHLAQERLGPIKPERARAHAEAMRRYRAGLPCGMCIKCEEIAAARWRLQNQDRWHDQHGATS